MRRAFLVLICVLGLPAHAQRAQGEDKPSITVLDFAASGISVSEAEVFADFMSAHIVETGVFRVIDRMQRQSLLQEIEFSQAGCADEECQLEIGRLLAASRIVVGSIGKVGDYVLLNLKLIMVETGETLRSASGRYEDLNEMVEDTERLASDLVREAPAPPAVETPTVAEALWSERRRERLQEEMDHLLRTVDTQRYGAWLERSNLAALEAAGALEDKLAFLKQYLRASAPHGISLELGGLLEAGAGTAYTDESWWRVGIGARAGFLYQFGRTFSLGFSLLLDGGWIQGFRGPGYGTVIGSPELVLGNKVEGLAALVGLGVGFEPGLFYERLPVGFRVGLYYRGFNVCYMVAPSVSGGGRGVCHYLTVGHSIFLGERGE